MLLLMFVCSQVWGGSLSWQGGFRPGGVGVGGNSPFLGVSVLFSVGRGFSGGGLCPGGDLSVQGGSLSGGIYAWSHVPSGGGNSGPGGSVLEPLSGGGSMWKGGGLCRKESLWKGRDHPALVSSDTHRASERYASYLNAFLLNEISNG